MQYLKLLKQFWNHLPKESHIKLFWYMILILFSSILEILSIGSILPLLGVLTNPENVFNAKILKPVFEIINIKSPSEILLPISIFFGVSALAAGMLRLFVLRYSTNLTFTIAADLSIDIYKKTMYQPYKVHVSRNSSEVITGIVTKANGVMGLVLQPVLGILNSSILLILILLTIITINPFIAGFVFISFGLFYLIVALYTKRKLLVNGGIIAHEQNNMMKSLNEGLGGIRDVLLDGTQEVFCDEYIKSDYQLRKASADNYFINNGPRYAIEAFGMVLVAIFAYYLNSKNGGLTSAAIPLLGSLALTGQRLLPVIQQTYSSWTIIRSGRASLLDVLELLDQPMPEHAINPITDKMKFQKLIELKNIHFKYSEKTPHVLKNINFVIHKGNKVGIIGKTGSGKSTLTDILMALLEPNEGNIFIDGEELNSQNLRSWQLNIAHVPQSIYLSDTTFAENIAFGVRRGDIDFQKVKDAAQKAQISEHIESLELQYNTNVGERGVRLSGGQRQRIGIARALYKDASVIIFDEATSALDNETEQFVMEAIDGLGKDLTIVIIAHRISTIKNCDFVVELNKGQIARTGSYSQLFQNQI